MSKVFKSRTGYTEDIKDTGAMKTYKIPSLKDMENLKASVCKTLINNIAALDPEYPKDVTKDQLKEIRENIDITSVFLFDLLEVEQPKEI